MSRALKSWPLTPADRDGPPQDKQHGARPRLWLAVHLPRLIVEAGGRASAGRPRVVVERQRGRTQIVAVNAAAGQAGIRAGCSLNAARALIESVDVFERCIAAERGRLESLAAWADCLTSLTSIEPPDALLLEVQGSLRLFGSVATIRARLGDELARRGLSWQASLAPTPLAALWLARAGQQDAPSMDGLAGRLGSLPVEVAVWPAATRKLLTELGITRIGECARLPRGGFARRAGRQCLDDLDRAMGRRPDPRAAFDVPRRFEGRIELTAETQDAARLLEAIRRVLEPVCARLGRHQLEAGSVRIALEHRDAPATVHEHRPARPTCRAASLLEPLTLALERLTLPAACIAVGVEARQLEPLRREAADLFGGIRSGGDEAVTGLLDRLRSRLGPGSVHGLGLAAEHRPERVWRSVDPAAAALPAPATLSPWVRQRPLWLLPEPVPLDTGLARFRYERPLQSESPPERIESGWWDGGDIRRDYFVAVAAGGQRLWIYRDRRAGSWHLHGIFG